ncbi:hypothetical protein D9M72_491010 [compost metagenome]
MNRSQCFCGLLPAVTILQDNGLANLDHQSELTIIDLVGSPTIKKATRGVDGEMLAERLASILQGKFDEGCPNLAVGEFVHFCRQKLGKRLRLAVLISNAGLEQSEKTGIHRAVEWRPCELHRGLFRTSPCPDCVADHQVNHRLMQIDVKRQ